MPERDGVELGRQILNQWPEQRILYISGHQAEVVRHGLPNRGVPLLLKPYTRDEALAKVRQALETRHGMRADEPKDR
jgi:DNA-binding response OmpR family regulator